LLAFGLAAVAIAAGKTFTLVLNGQIFKDKAITVSGKTYVPLSAIQALGVKVSTGGSAVSLTMPAAPAATKPATSSTPVAVTQPSTSPVTGNTDSSGAGGTGPRPSVEGCIGENLFNGVWRFRVASVNLVEGDGKRLFSVVVEFRNGTNKTVSLYDTGISTDRSRGINVILEDEQTLVVDYDGNAWDSAAYKAIPQGGLLRHTFTYSLNAETAKPAKFLFEVDPTKLPQNLGFKFSVPAPSFRVDLTCTK
jgi:hypothetical protein